MKIIKLFPFVPLGLLNLVDIIISQENIGHLGLHEFHLLWVFGIGVRVKQGLNQLW